MGEKKYVGIWNVLYAFNVCCFNVLYLIMNKGVEQNICLKAQRHSHLAPYSNGSLNTEKNGKLLKSPKFL